MKTNYTKNELTNKVSGFYKGYLTIDKALKLFDLEYGFTPTLVERKNIVDEAFIATMDYPSYIDAESLTYMKDLQESGVTNMFAATPYIQAALLLDRKEAADLLKTYMKDYELIYYPENTL